MYQDWMEKIPVLADIEIKNKNVQCCPVCGGKGFVPNGFYDNTGFDWISITAVNETCRSCNGKGYIII